MVRRYCAIVFAAVLCAGASAAESRDDCVFFGGVQSPSGLSAGAACPLHVATDFVDAQFARLGRLMAQPPDADSPIAGAPQQPVDVVPAVPAAGGLAVVGFLLISFVHDRKFWLAAAASAVLCVGAAPKIAARLAGLAHAADTAAATLIENEANTSDCERADYCANLRHPLKHYGGKAAFFAAASAGIRRPVRTLQRHGSSQALQHSTTFTNAHLMCAGRQTRRFMISTPEITLVQLARGPPD